MRPVPGERLRDLGPLWITETACRQYIDGLRALGRAAPASVREAHAELAGLLGDARQQRREAKSGASRWRWRNKRHHLDIEAFVDLAGDEARVTYVRIRNYK